jgi:hypothetical protein
MIDLRIANVRPIEKREKVENTEPRYQRQIKLPEKPSVLQIAN